MALAHLTSLLRNLLHKQREERELDDEVRSYELFLADEKILAGMNPQEARRQAHLELGGVEQLKEQVREIRAGHLLETLYQDIRYGLRMLAKNPGFTVVAVLTLALGIGANTAIFSLINAIMLRSLPIKDPQQLVFFSRSNIERNGLSSFPYPFYWEVRDHNSVFSGVICQSGMGPSLSVNGSSERVNGELVSGNFFEVLGIKPYIGRLFTSDDDRVPGGHPVVVLGYGFWKRRFGSDPAVVGRAIQLNTTTMTVIGISAPGFESLNVGSSPDIRAPMMMMAEMRASASMLENRNDWWLNIAARLKPGITREQAQSSIQTMLTAYLETNDAGHSRTEYQQRKFASERIDLLPAARGHQVVPQYLTRSLLVLIGVVGAVLLIACINIANLLLARTSVRRREVAVRLALGATRNRLVRQLLTESFLVAAIGGLLGIVAAYWGAKLLLSLFASARLAMSLNITPDSRVLGFTLLISLCATLLVGLAPALQAARRDVVAELKGDSTSSVFLRLTGRRFLVSAQVFVSLLLLIGAGLFLRSLHNLLTMDMGFDREDVLQLNLDPKLAGYKEEQTKAFYREVTGRLSSLPGVRSVSFANIGLVSGSGWGSGIKIEGYNPREGDMGPDRNTVGPGYFATLRIPIVSGRDFNYQDTENAPHVAIVNEKFAKFYFGNGNPLGRRIGPQNPQENSDYTIVGIAKDGKYADLREETPRFWYIPYDQFKQSGGVNFYIRTVGNPEKMVARIRHEVEIVDRNVPISNIRTLDMQIEEDLTSDRFVAALSSFFSVLAAILAALGLYGVLAYWVTRRTREIGIRMALGAERENILRLVLREAILLVLAGMAVAIPAAFGLTRFVSSMLYGIHGTDRLALLGATLLMSSVALIAGYLPARRATKIDPLVALRYE